MGSRKRGLRKLEGVALHKFEWLEPRCVLSAAHFGVPSVSHSLAGQQSGSNWGDFSWNGSQSNAFQTAAASFSSSRSGADDWNGFTVSNFQNGFDGRSGQSTFDIREPSSYDSFTSSFGDHDGFGDSRFGNSGNGSLGFSQPVSPQPIASPPTSSLTSTLSSDSGSAQGSSCTSTSDSSTTSIASSIASTSVATTGDSWTTSASSGLTSVVTSITGGGDFGVTLGNQFGGLGSFGGGQLGGGPGSGGPLGLNSLGGIGSLGLGSIGEIAPLGPTGPAPEEIIGSLVSTSTGALGALASTVTSAVPTLDIGHTKPIDMVTSLVSPLLALNVSVAANLDSASVSASTVQHSQVTATIGTTSHSTTTPTSTATPFAQLPAAIPATASSTVVVDGGALPNLPLPTQARASDAAGSKGAATVGNGQLAVVHGDARAATTADAAILALPHETAMAAMPVSVAAVDRAIQTVMGEIGEVGKGFSRLLDGGRVNATSVAVGVATIGAAAGYYLRRRGSRKAEEIEDEASSSWLFDRLQPIPRS